MKRLLMVLLLTGLLIFVSNLVFSADHFEEMPIQLEVSAYDYNSEQFSEAIIIIVDREEITSFIHALNKADHENGAFEVSRFEDYNVQMIYDDGTIDELGLWFDFDEDYDMFRSVNTSGIFKLKDDEARENLRRILE